MTEEELHVLKAKEAKILTLIEKRLANITALDEQMLALEKAKANRLQDIVKAQKRLTTVRELIAEKSRFGSTLTLKRLQSDEK